MTPAARPLLQMIQQHAVLLFSCGGMLYGVLSGQPGISWLGHLCGFLAGIAGAWLLVAPNPVVTLVNDSEVAK